MTASPMTRTRTHDRPRRRRAVLVTTAVLLATGAAPAAAAVTPASLAGWGQNTNGQLGLGNTANVVAPTAVAGIDDARQVAIGNSSTLVLRGGVPYGTGYNVSGQIGRNANGPFSTLAPLDGGLTTVAAIASGRYHTLLLLEDGTVRALGANDGGQLGTTGGTSSARTPVPTAVPGLTNVTALAGGWAHSVALLADGTVRAWGVNANNELGTGTGTTSGSPVAVPGVSDVVAIAAGEHTLALRRDGRVYAWGLNVNGQLGLGDTNPRTAPELVPGITDAVAVSAGRWHSLVLLADGTVRAFGSNNSGRLGDGSATDRPTPVRVTGLTGVVEINGLLAGSSARRADGTVWMWGNGAQGQLADGVAVAGHVSAVPVRAPGVRAQALGVGGTGSFQLPILHVPVAADGPLSFASQARDTLSAPRTVTLTVGTGDVTRLRTVGPDADDFLVSGDDCVGADLNAGDTCTVRVRFSPSAAGARSAQLRISSTTADDVLVELDGEGGEPAAGPQGPKGDDGATGRDGRDGALGPIGPIGPAGPVGAAGPAGVAGPKGEKGGSPTASPRATVACRRIGSGTRVRCTVRSTTKGRLRVTGRIGGGKASTRSGRSGMTLTLTAPRRNARPLVSVVIRAADGSRATVKVRVGATKTSSLRSAR